MRALPVLLVVLLASACARDEATTETLTVTTATTVTVTETTTGTTTETTTAPPGSWAGLPLRLPPNGTLPVDVFDAYAESVDEPWEQSLLGTTDEFVGRDVSDGPDVSFQATSGSEGAGPASATLVLDGLLDDSIRARRYNLTLSRRDDGTWRIDSGSWAQRCREERGHQAFSPAPCV
jgi:hypothetical protein